MNSPEGEVTTYCTPIRILSNNYLFYPFHLESMDTTTTCLTDLPTQRPLWIEVVEVLHK